ncbi:hypothetical protein HBI51_104550 [Parastagonospora nodorum]|nr:hypothetical protein HBI51_104550 [Parastagonospora nodorum]
MNAYLQRADDFIQQQIYKFEQKRQGRDYAEMHSSPKHNQQRPPRAQTFNNAPQQGPPAPRGWSQEYDPQSQRWYYIERSTGRAQWDPPSFSQNRRRHRHTLSEHQQSYADTSRDEEMARRMQDEEARARSRHRASSHMSRPNSGSLDIPQQHQRLLSTSPHPGPNGRLPPGTHLDMRTGQVVTNMFPPDHPMNAQ